jgi:hypothetical protein
MQAQKLKAAVANDLLDRPEIRRGDARWGLKDIFVLIQPETSGLGQKRRYDARRRVISIGSFPQADSRDHRNAPASAAARRDRVEHAAGRAFGNTDDSQLTADLLVDFELIADNTTPVLSTG